MSRSRTRKKNCRFNISMNQRNSCDRADKESTSGISSCRSGVYKNSTSGVAVSRIETFASSVYRTSLSKRGFEKQVAFIFFSSMKNLAVQAQHADVFDADAKCTFAEVTTEPYVACQYLKTAGAPAFETVSVQ